MRTAKEVAERQAALKLQRSHYAFHLKVLEEREDLHGVMDCAADLRELDAKIGELDWVLGGMGS